MNPSSLVFCAIVAMWAVYVLGRWRRRREQQLALAAMAEFSRDLHQLPTGRPLTITTREPSPISGLPRGRRLMGLLLAGNLISGTATFILAILSIISWKIPFLQLALAVLLVAALRASVLRSRDLAHRQSARTRRRASASGRRRRRSLIREVLARRAAQAPPAVTNEPEVDLALGEVAAGGAQQPSRSEPTGDTWEPIAVPRPTYQMKARAPVAAPIPMAPAVEDPAADSSEVGAAASVGGASVGAGATPEVAAAHSRVAPGAGSAAEEVPADEEQDQPDFDLDAVLERRIAANE
ncbi:MAG: hypothetical protein ACRC0L_10850 [Angustibacter sp.]